MEERKQGVWRQKNEDGTHNRLSPGTTRRYDFVDVETEAQRNPSESVESVCLLPFPRN